MLLAILFSLIINGIAITLFVTTSNELKSSASHVVANEAFNVAEAGLNIGLLRIKAVMEAHDPIEPGTPFIGEPFELASEEAAGSANLTISQFRYFDLVTLAPLPSSTVAQINSGYVDTHTDTYTGSIDGFFKPQTSNPALFEQYLSGAEPEYRDLLDTGESQILRAWRLFLVNNDDGNDKTATLVSVGYILDLRNNVMYQRRVEATVYIHGMDVAKQTDPTGQLTSSSRGARTGRFRVEGDASQPVSSYDLQ